MLRVSYRNGNFMFEGRLGPKNMYVYRMLVPHQDGGTGEVKRGCLEQLESQRRLRDQQPIAHNGEVTETVAKHEEEPDELTPQEQWA